MTANYTKNKQNEISDEHVEASIIDTLFDRFGENENLTTYLASSRRFIGDSSSILSSEMVSKIFKEKSKYYSGVREVKTDLQHIDLYITPELARDMLQYSRRGAINPEHKNRKISKARVKSYAEAMKESKWCLTGEPIIISSEGEILNGHHRLEASCESQSGFIAPVTYGVTDDLSFAHIDVGNNRTRSQVLEMAGVEVSPSVLSRVAMLAKAFESTKNPFAFRGTQGTSYAPAQILTFVEQNVELALSVAFVSEVVKRHKLESQASEAIYAFAHYLIKKKLIELPMKELPLTPESYLTRVISSIGLESEEDVEYQVRNYLQSLVHESTSYALLCKLSAIFKGWNMHLGISVSGNRISVRRVARYKKDQDGNNIPLPASGNINEPFTIPCVPKGKTPRNIQRQSNIQIRR